MVNEDAQQPLVGDDKPKGRPPRLALLGVAVIAALVVAGGVAAFFLRRGNAEPDTPPSPAPPPPPPPPLPVCHFAKRHERLGVSRTRTLEFVNDCPGRLMVNMQGFTWPDPADFLMHELPGDGGFPLAPGERVTYEVPERLFSGRIWARPNCTSPCDPLSCGPQGTLWCDTGNCPGANETTCRQANGAFVGGLPPGPLLELTLCGGRGANLACYVDAPEYNEVACNSLPLADFYDLSNVDGTSRVWAALEAVGGRKLSGPGAPKGEFNCGSPRMPGAFNFSLCPGPMRVGRNDSQATGFSSNVSAGDAVGCLSACHFLSLFGASKNLLANRTGEPDRNLTGPALSAVTPDDIAATCCECGHGVDNGVCPAPLPNGTWPPPNKKCVAGCSPFGNYPVDYKPSQCSLEDMPTIVTAVGKKNESIRLGQVQAIFKHWAPEAYSWQFDDLASTFLCEEADYRLHFCPETNPEPAPQ